MFLHYFFILFQFKLILFIYLFNLSIFIILYQYHRLYKKKNIAKDGGRILLEIKRKRTPNLSSVKIRDRAEGMTLEDMKKKLAEVGEKRSEDGDRGFMSRGAKDCTSLGNITFESIKDDRYCKAQITTDAKFIPLANKRVDSSLRKALRIERGNGTVVHIETKHPIPKIDTILQNY